MPVSDEHQLIFIHIPKNAGTAITEAFGMSDEGHHPVEYYGSKYPLKWREYDIFTVVRNPYDRFVSNYEYATMDESYWHSKDGDAVHGVHPDYHMLKGKTFEECAQLYYESPRKFQSKHWRPQVDWLKGEVPYEREMEIIKYEDGLQDQINDKLGVNIELPTINTTDKEYSEYKVYYNKDLYQMIYMCYSRDFKKFDYSTGSWG